MLSAIITASMKQLFFPLLAVVLCGSTAMAALDLSEIGVGARPLSLGKAYFALADDASAIFTNPAGLSRNKSLNLISMSGAMLGDVNYIMLGVSEMSPLGKFGVGYVNAAVGSIPLTQLVGSGPSLEAQQYGVSDYNSNLIVFSYGSKLSRFLRNGAGSNVALGASLKIFSQGFTGGSSSAGGSNPLNDATGSGMDADLGLLWDANQWLDLGLTLQNFLPESFGGKFTWQKNAVTEGIPLIAHLGGRVNVFGPDGIRANWDQKMDLLFDLEKNNDQNRPNAYHAGVEYWPLENLALRGGLDQKAKAAEGGTGVDNNLTAGVGFFLAGFTFDYAYHQFGELSENSTHFFSVGYRGEEQQIKESLKAKAEKRKSTIPQPEIVSKPLLKTFPDVPPGYWARKPIEYLTTLNIMDPYEDGNFYPTKEITRGELAVLLVKAKGFEVTKEIKVRFVDVPLQSYEAPYVSLAVERKYINGFPDGTFQPNKRITRAETATILARFSGLYLKPKIAKPPYWDVPVDHWAAPAIAATKDTGLFAYIADRGFGPKMYLTRAEAAEIIAKTPFAKQKIEDLISGGE
jgi:hypothetical protein